MDKLLVSPPVVFIIILFASLFLSYLFSRLSFKPKKTAADAGKSYACGEENYNHTAHPDYSIFFPFAFFFTLAHVATLLITTVPAGAVSKAGHDKGKCKGYLDQTRKYVVQPLKNRLEM